MADIGRLLGLVNQIALAKRDFDFAQGVSRVSRRNMFARRNLRIFVDPGAVGRNPFRVKDYLRDLAVTDIYREVLAANTDFINVDKLAILPEAHLKCRDIDINPDVRLRILKRGAVDPTP